MALCLARSRKLAISSRTRDSLVKGGSSLSPRRSVSEFQNFTAEEVVAGARAHIKGAAIGAKLFYARVARSHVCVPTHTTRLYVRIHTRDFLPEQDRDYGQERVVPLENRIIISTIVREKSEYTYRAGYLESDFFSNKIISLKIKASEIEFPRNVKNCQ